MTNEQKNILRSMELLRPIAKGVVLIVVLVVVAMLALSAYAFCSLMLTEYSAAKINGKRLKTRHFVDSGAEFIRIYVSQTPADITSAGGIFDNPEVFQGVLVESSDDPREVGMFTSIAPGLTDEGNIGGIRYGLVDESTKLNLNILTLAEKMQTDGGRTLLMALPNMTLDTADAILDWVDEDDNPREYGAEVDYYSGLNPPYAPKNGPMDTIEELLLVKGVSPQLLFGLDTNQNGTIDVAESQSLEGVDASMALGWSSYMTLFSKERNLNRDGLRRVNLNEADLQKLYDDLRSVLNDELSTFIIAYRLFGPYTGMEETSPEIVTIDQLDLTQSGSTPFAQVLDIVDARVQVEIDSSTNIIIESPIKSADQIGLGVIMPILMDNLSVQANPWIAGRINLMQASRTVILGIPGMTEELADEIIDYRRFELTDLQGQDINRQFETWLLVEGRVDLTTMRQLVPFICSRGHVYSAEITGYFQDVSASSRSQIIFDATEPIPRILFWRDKSHLPLGYSVETLGANYSQ